MPLELIQLLEFYRRFLSDHGLSLRYQGRNIVYDSLRQVLGNWEVANVKTIKDALDAEDNAFAGRNTTTDWLQP